jgi:hypothetical protein
MYVCGVTHIHHAARVRISRRCPPLVPDPRGGPVARRARLAFLRRSPCVREHCGACRAGDQHTSHVVYGRVKGRRFALYVPEALVPEVRRCLDHGRALQDLLAQAAVRYIRALKLERTTALKKKA